MGNSDEIGNFRKYFSNFVVLNFCIAASRRVSSLTDSPQPPQFDRSRSYRYVVAGAMTIAIAIIVMTALLILELRRQALENGRTLVRALTQVTAEQTAQTFLAVDLLLRQVQDLSMKPGLSDPDAFRSRARTRQYHDSLVDLQGLLPQVDAVAVLDADGTVIASSRSFPPPAPLGLADALVFRTLHPHPELGLVMDGPVYRPVTGRWMIYLGRALTDEAGRFAGVAVIGITTAYFENQFSTVNIGAKGSIALTTEDLRLVAGWPKADYVTGQRVIGPPPLASDTLPKVAITAGSDGRKRVAADSRLGVPGVGLHLAVTQAESVLLKPWRSMALAISASTAVALVVIATLTLFLLRWLSEESRWRRVVQDRENRLSAQAADLMAARDQAETAQRARGQFLANMSHELRTPLNAVLGFSDIFRQEMLGPIGNPKYREFAEDIHSSGRHLLDIINNILDLTKIDSGKLELADDEVDIADLLAFCGKLVADTARSGDVSLEIAVPPQAPTLHGDTIRLRQILLNLLSNAIKFTPAGGRIMVSGELAGAAFVLRITDTGIGMTPDEAHKAMQPFYQVDNSNARRYEGTGLGLPLTKSLVELHGGSIRIDSTRGQGTTVTVSLPIARTA
jgi:signal transduction histidine kinase